MTRGVLSVGDEEVDLVACRSHAPAAKPGSLVDATVARCDAGDAASCVAAGAMYESGHEVARDPSRARALYHRACEAGHAPGCRLEAAMSQGSGGQ